MKLKHCSFQTLSEEIILIPHHFFQKHCEGKLTHQGTTFSTNQFVTPDLEQIKLVCTHVQSGARAFWVLCEGGRDRELA